MNKVILLFSFVTVVLFFIFPLISEHAQLELIPRYNKLANNSRSLFDIEKSLNRNWRAKNIENEFYLKDAVKTIVFGWKLFEEWNWYCINCVSPLINEFQKINILEEYEKTLNEFIKNTKMPYRAIWSNLELCTTIGSYQRLARIKRVTFNLNETTTYLIDPPSGGIWKTTDNTSVWVILYNNEPIPYVREFEYTVPNDQPSTANLSQVNENRIKIVLVKGSGKSNPPKNYPVLDNNLPDRINFLNKFKMKDNNGYYKSSSIVFTIQILDYALLLNSLNIFIAATKIENKRPIKINMLLKVYDIPENKVAT